MKKESMKNISIKKNEQYIVDIIDNGFSGEGIAKIKAIINTKTDNFIFILPLSIMKYIFHFINELRRSLFVTINFKKFLI